MKKAISVNKKDNVATVLDDVKKGDSLEVYDMENNVIDTLDAIEDIPYGNKLALEDIELGADVIKYGERIGKTIREISKYQLAHVHNIESFSIDIPEPVKEEVMRKMNIK